MKKILSLIIISISFSLFIRINAEEYEKFKSGDLVRYNNIAFYVLFDSDSSSDNVQLLKMVPLTHDEINKYTDGKAVKLDSYNYSESNTDYSYGNMAYYYSDECYGCRNADICARNNHSGCINVYELSNVKKVVDAWTQENIDTKDIVAFDDSYNARLLNINEIIQFDSRNDGNNNWYYINNAPNWITKPNFYSWIIDDNSSEYSYAIYSNRMYLDSYYVYNEGSVRPTIKLKKNSIKKFEFNEYHNNQVREYKIGDIINYNDTSFYVIKNSDKGDNTITLLKNEPLTKYELEKYGEGYINNYINYYNGNYIEQGKTIDDNGFYKVAFLSTSECYSTKIDYSYFSYDYSDCNTNYDISNAKHIVDNWLVDTISDDDIAKDNIGYNARLLNSEDLVNLGYVGMQVNTAGQDSFKISNDTPEFMMIDNTKGMLTMIPSYSYTYNGYVYSGDNNTSNVTVYGISVADDGYSFIARSIPSDSIGTVRPVVTLNKKEIASKITNVDEDYKSDNIEVTIETEVKNDKLDEKTIISTPNTLLRNNIVYFIVGILLAIISVSTYLYFRKMR